jgi:hypothetical protein
MPSSSVAVRCRARGPVEVGLELVAGAARQKLLAFVLGARGLGGVLLWVELGEAVGFGPDRVGVEDLLRELRARLRWQLSAGDGVDARQRVDLRLRLAVAPFGRRPGRRVVEVGDGLGSGELRHRRLLDAHLWPGARGWRLLLERPMRRRPVGNYVVGGYQIAKSHRLLCRWLLAHDLIGSQPVIGRPSHLSDLPSGASHLARDARESAHTATPARLRRPTHGQDLGPLAWPRET